MTWKSKRMSPYYHGTSKKIAAKIEQEGFRLSKGWRQKTGYPFQVENKAFFFTEKRKYAKAWAVNRSMTKYDFAILQVDLDLKKTFDVTDRDFMKEEGSNLLMRSIGWDPNELDDLDNFELQFGVNPTTGVASPMSFMLFDRDKVIEGLKAAGYDSAIVPEQEEFGSRSIAVFGPEQIKNLERLV